MAKIIITLFFVLGLIFCLPLNNSWARTESTNYIIWADVFSIGGSEIGTSTNYIIQDTLGEALIWSATTTSAGYGLKAGFREMYADQYITLAASATSIDLGTLSNLEAKTASHTLTVDTNATKGFTITVSGNTLTSGANTITAIGAITSASAPGTEQFGINLVANTSPSVGADPSGTSPIGSVADQYNLANYFAFNSGDTIATSTTDINETTYTVSYLANININTELGSYSTTLTYAATANF